MQPGSRIGPYEVIRKLGQGATGAVYLGRHASLGFQHAVKVLAAEDADPNSIKRFQREMESLGRIDHPGIVRIHAAGITGTSPYFAMDFVEGVTLRSAIKEGLSRDRVLELIEEVALALGHVHRRGLVHRDAKPENIMVQDTHARLTDFGLAKVLGVSSQSLTATGELLGTPCYMAPEQVTPKLGDISSATDVFALGAMLYEAYEGAPPYQSPHYLTTFARLGKGEPAPPLGKHAPTAISSVCARALEVDPRVRYADGLAFYRALAEARAPSVRARSSRLLRVFAACGLLAAGAALGVVGERVSAGSAPKTEGLEVPAPSKGSGALPDDSSSTGATLAPIDLLTLSEVPRLAGPQLGFGTKVTAAREDRWSQAVIVGDSGDEGYDLVFADGEGVRQVPSGGFLPDVFAPGAECHVKRWDRPVVAGTIVERRGQAVLVDSDGERQWLPLTQVWLTSKQRVPAPQAEAQADDPQEVGRMVWAFYKETSTSYPAVELERRDGSSRVIYLDGSEMEWRTPTQLEPSPATGSQVVFKPFGTDERVKAEVVDRKEGVMLLRNQSGQELWVALARIHVRH